MNFQDLNLENLDINEIGSWPLFARIGVIIIVVAVLMGVGYWYDIQDKRDNLSKAEVHEEELKELFRKERSRANNKELLREQIKELEETFKTISRQLPGTAEVDALLVDISQAGLSAGLEFELFKPGKPISYDSNNKEFKSLSIQIKVIGSYHDFGKFVSTVAALSRIVTLHDISLVTTGNKKGKLTMDVIAKIYQYQDEGNKK